LETIFILQVAVAQNSGFIMFVMLKLDLIEVPTEFSTKKIIEKKNKPGRTPKSNNLNRIKV